MGERIVIGIGEKLGRGGGGERGERSGEEEKREEREGGTAFFDSGTKFNRPLHNSIKTRVDICA